MAEADADGPDPSRTHYFALSAYYRAMAALDAEPDGTVVLEPSLGQALLRTCAKDPPRPLGPVPPEVRAGLLRILWERGAFGHGVGLDRLAELPASGSLARDRTAGRARRLQVASVPTVAGIRLSLFLSSRARLPCSLDQLGLDPRSMRMLRAAMARDRGIIMLAGPGGAGKTTTTTAALHELNTPDRLVMTVEGVVEVFLRGVPQTYAWQEPYVPYHRLVRAAMLHKPDVLLACKPEDYPSSLAIFDAALEGRLVFSAIHTRSAPAVTGRLLDQGLEAWKLAEGLALVLAQRLVPKLCRHCARPTPPPAGTLEALGLTAAALARWELEPCDPARLVFMGAPGCEACHHRGTWGLVPAVSAMEMTGRLAAAIRQGSSVRELDALARADGMWTLRESGLRLAAQGQVDLATALRITSDYR